MVAGGIPIDSITQVSQSPHSELIFCIDTDARQYRFAAQDPHECNEWIEALQATLSSLRVTQHLPSTPSPPHPLL